MKSLFLYDITRLVARRNRAAPSGIDRVDLQIVTYLRKRHNAVLVAQNGPALVRVPSDLADRYFEHLRIVWQNGISRTSFEEPFLACGIVSRRRKQKKPPPRIRDRIQRWFKRTFKPLRWLVGAIRILSFRLLANGRIPGRTSLPIPTEPASGPRPIAVKAPPFYISDDLLALLTANNGRVIYFNFSHHNLNNADLFQTLSNYKAHFLICIHDLIPIDWPEYNGREEHAELHAQRLRAVLDANAQIVCPTKDVGARVKRLCNEWGLRPPTVSVLPNGTEGIDPNSVAPATIGRPYFIVVGTIEGRKNHLMLLQTWRRLSERMKESPMLIIVGKRGWANGAVLDLLDRCPALRSNTLELNSISDDSLFELLVGARALLFPSFAEGWGIPAVEALSVGVPALCSDIPALREATQGCAEYIDPYDLPAWEKAVTDFLSPASDRRQRAIERLRGFRPIYWEDVHAKLETVIERIK